MLLEQRPSAVVEACCCSAQPPAPPPSLPVLPPSLAAAEKATQSTPLTARPPPSPFEVQLDAAIAQLRREVLLAAEAAPAGGSTWGRLVSPFSNMSAKPSLMSGNAESIFGGDGFECKAVSGPVFSGACPGESKEFGQSAGMPTRKGSAPDFTSAGSNVSQATKPLGCGASESITSSGLTRAFKGKTGFTSAGVRPQFSPKRRLSTASKFSLSAMMESRKSGRTSQSSVGSSALFSPTSRHTKLEAVLCASHSNLGDRAEPGSLKVVRKWASRCLPLARVPRTLVERKVMSEVVMGMIIVLNAISIGLSLDLYPGSVGWIFVDAAFALVFGLELLINLRRGCRVLYCGEKGLWNLFETVLVCMAWTECMINTAAYVAHRTSNSMDIRMIGMVRIFRLARVARVIRLIRLPIFSELLMMINGALGGLRTLMWSYLLLAVPLYLVAMLLRQSLGELPPVEDARGSRVAQAHFSSLSSSLLTSFRCLVAADCNTADGKPIFVLISETYGGGYALLYCLTIVFFTFGLFNVIVAIYVENTVAAAKFNEIRQKQARLNNQRMFRKRAFQLVELIWDRHPNNVSGCSIADLSPEDASRVQVSPAMFEELCQMKGFQDILKELDIAEEEQMYLLDTLDADGGGTVDLEELVQGIAKLRGDARRSDVVSISLMVRALMDEFMLLKHNLPTSSHSVHRSHRRMSAPGEESEPLAAAGGLGDGHPTSSHSVHRTPRRLSSPREESELLVAAGGLGDGYGDGLFNHMSDIQERSRGEQDSEEEPYRSASGQPLASPQEAEPSPLPSPAFSAALASELVLSPAEPLTPETGVVDSADHVASKSEKSRATASGSPNFCFEDADDAVPKSCGNSETSTAAMTVGI